MPRAAAQDVVAVLAEQIVVAGAAVDKIQAAAAVDDVVRRAADQDVVSAGAGEIVAAVAAEPEIVAPSPPTRRRRDCSRSREAVVDGELHRGAAGVAALADLVGEHRERARHLRAIGDLDLDDDAAAAAALDRAFAAAAPSPALLTESR